jgi:hypothetical protein
MTRYLPIALGVVLIVGLTIVQVRMTDRLSASNVTAEQRAALLKNVPMNIGDWHGTDKPVDEGVKQTAGAEGAVSRQYRNARTGEVVDLWLIVGHGRAISAHTPDICYRSSGFAARAVENSMYPMMMEDESEVPFLTNTFFREDHLTGRQLYRVFWSWYNTETDGDKVVWEAPSNARWYFGNTRALYKMYFTSVMRDPMETAEQSPCLQFAREFIPVVNKALSQVHGDETAATPVATNETASDEAESKDADVNPEAAPVEATEDIAKETETAESPAADTSEK